MALLSLDRSRLRWFGVAAGACLAACGSSEVIVESTFPTPLIEPLPVSMGVIIPDELYNFIYTEDIPDQSLWTIALGDANVAMLAPLFKGMFRETPPMAVCLFWLFVYLGGFLWLATRVVERKEYVLEQ